MHRMHRLLRVGGCHWGVTLGETGFNSTLGIKQTAHTVWNRAEGSTTRLVPGFCWEWHEPTLDGTLVEDVVIGARHRPCNGRSDAGRLATGIPRED